MTHFLGHIGALLRSPEENIYRELGSRLNGQIMPEHFAAESADEILTAVGSSIVACSWDPLHCQDGAIGMVDGRVYLTACILREAQEITGVMFAVGTAGVFTGDNNNKIGLYRIDEADTAIERIAQSLNSNGGTIWKSTGVIQVPFTAPILLEPGLYFTALLFNRSTVTTEPGTAGISATPMGLANPKTGSAPHRAMMVDSQTDLAASYTYAGLSTHNNPRWTALY